MKFCLFSFLLLAEKSSGFIFPSKGFTAPMTSRSVPSTSIRSSLKDDETKTKEVKDVVEQHGLEQHGQHDQPEIDPDAEGLPWWWEWRDGLVVDFQWFGSIGAAQASDGRTATHEIGHFCP